MTDARTAELLFALEDLHEMVKRKPLTKLDSGFPEFRVRARPMLAKYEHQLRTAGTMDKTTFVSAFSWFFHMSAPGNVLEMAHPDGGQRRLRLRIVGLPLGYCGVAFEPLLYRPEGPFHTTEKAAEVVWRFLQGENPPESTGWR